MNFNNLKFNFGKGDEMDKLKEILLSEIPGFKETGLKFLNKEITKMEFKGVSGGFGAYAHRDGQSFMIRLRIPSGITSKEELKIIYDMAKKYNLDHIHLTTRQAIQFHGLSIEDICEVMEEGLKHNIYTRGAGGNYPRNVAMSPLSGVDPNEIFDVTPYAIATNNHFLKKIYTYKLPRKLKVAFSNNNVDEGHCTVHDLGFVACKKDNKDYFKVFLGGGLGRNPKLSLELDELVEPKDVLYHIEAMTNLFINEGNYENKSKARIRYMVEKLGEEGFLNEYKKYLKQAKEKGGLDVNPEPINYTKKGLETTIQDKRLFKQKQSGLYSVYFHPIGGQLSMKDFKVILDELDKIENPIIRLAMTEGIYFINLNGTEAESMLKATSKLGGETALEQSVSCIGVPICQMGLLESQKELNSIVDYFREHNFNSNILPRIHISGCGNSCGVHQIGEIGLTGKMKRVNDKSTGVFELHIGGNVGVGKAALGECYGDIEFSKVPEFLYEIALKIKDSNKDFCTWVKENNSELREIVTKFAV